MDIVLNTSVFPLSVANTEAAIGYIDELFDLAIELKRRKNEEEIYILQHTPISALNLFENLSFQYWLSRKEQPKRIVLLGMLTKRIRLSEYPYYTCFGFPASDLGYAYENKLYAVSADILPWTVNCLTLLRESFEEEQNPNSAVAVHDDLLVRNICKTSLDFHFPKRVFEAHPKHDKVHPMQNKGEKVSLLECSEEKAQELLNNAIDGKERSLYNYDRETGKIIEFKKTDKATYHGYHLDRTDVDDSIVKLLSRYRLLPKNF